MGVRESLVERAMSAAAEAVSLADLGNDVLPRLQQAARASATLLYRYDEQHRLTPIAGDIMSIIEHYARHYFHDDPVQTVPRRFAPQPRVVLATRHVDERAYHKSSAYGEFYSAFDLEHLACVWLTRRPYATAGMTGLLFTRPRRADDFDRADERLLAGALPMLSAAVARAERLGELDLQRQALEALANNAGPARLVLSTTGQLIWASAAADGRLAQGVPDALRAAARRLGDAALGKLTILQAPQTVMLGTTLAHLSLLRAEPPLVLVEIEDPPAASAHGEELARRFGLTPAEGTVLTRLGAGLSNGAIARELHVSVETVRTHVRRILGKLGLGSRVQAALLVARRS
jgi:DNA-binding CsgD family transcriptional regulator